MKYSLSGLSSFTSVGFVIRTLLHPEERKEENASEFIYSGCSSVPVDGADDLDCTFRIHFVNIFCQCARFARAWIP